MNQFLSGLTGQRHDAMAFLFTHLPPSDPDTYDRELFLSFTDHALALRSAAPWCAALDEEIFYHYVLFPRVNDEDLSFHREIFHAALWDRIKDLPSTEEMVLEVNRWCHEHASYEAQDDRTASPLTVYRSGSGRCGEESGFLVSALRSIGIPARQVYCPRWAHCDDNHAWVEALCDGKWRFLGACEPEPVIDRGWFNAPASRAVMVHSRLFGEGSHPLHGECIGEYNGARWFNQTSRYALTKRKTLRATINGTPAAGAVFHIQLLNEASFHTIAAVTADEQGEASVELGLGDIHILSVLGEYSAECDCFSEDSASLELSVFHNSGETPWRTVDYRAPADAPVNPSPLTAEQKKFRAGIIAYGNTRRNARIAAMCPDPSDELLLAARGNADVFLRFIDEHSHELGSDIRLALLESLCDKDLRDISYDTLDAHLYALPGHYGHSIENYRNYVVCPRIALEPLTPWRDELSERFTEKEKERIFNDPMILWHEFCRDIAPAETYGNLVWPPLTTLHGKRGNQMSLYILFVASLRALSFAARLRPLDGVPEYWDRGKWNCVVKEETGTLDLSSNTTPVYRQNWTLSRWNGTAWQLLGLDDTSWENGKCTLTLPVGQYRIITSVRLPRGDQFAAMREIAIEAGKTTESELHFRTYELSDMLRRQQLPKMSAVTLDDEAVEDICRYDGRPSILLWLEEGGEPTEHVLNELLNAREAFAALPANLVFLLRNREALAQLTLFKAVAAFPDARVLLDDWAYDLEQTARHLTCDPDQPPLLLVCDGEGNAVYGTSGYRVGSVELLRRIAEYVAEK